MLCSKAPQRKVYLIIEHISESLKSIDLYEENNKLL